MCAASEPELIDDYLVVSLADTIEYEQLLKEVPDILERCKSVYGDDYDIDKAFLDFLNTEGLTMIEAVDGDTIVIPAYYDEYSDLTTQFVNNIKQDLF